MTDGDEPSRRTRRRVLRLLVGGVGALTGCLGPTIRRAADRHDGTDSPTASAAPEQVTVAVAPEGEFGFYPGTESPLRIGRGTTVAFVWRTDSHNIVVDRQPDGADWEGSGGGPGEAYDAGHRHEHTFTAPGTYRFHCAPHETVGAVGTIEVLEEPPGRVDGG